MLPLPDPIVVVGSGASAVHFAQTALELGRRVVMLDVGRPKTAPVRPEASLNELKSDLEDPVRYFLGEHYESLILPSHSSEYYGLPPSKSYILEPLAGYDVTPTGIAPLLSFAQGGLAQAWTGGSYPFSEGELESFPFGWRDIEPHYATVARRIGISGIDDDLTGFIPWHDGLQTPVGLDAHALQLVTDYRLKSARLNRSLGFYMGRARVATIARDYAGRKGCSSLGRCLWGCPTQSLYTPSITLDQLRRHPAFEYLPGLRVDRFTFNDASVVTGVTASAIDGGETVERRVGTLVLAAGAIPSARILLESLHLAGARVELSGLMDNRQVLMPYVNLKQIGRPFADRSYQYHQLAIGVPGAHAMDYVHGLVTTLTTALVHPVVQTLPVGFRTALALFRNIHAALGLVNINFADRRRDTNRVGLDVDGSGRKTLLVSYRPDPGEAGRVAPMVARYRRFLRTLGCIAPPNMTRMRPMGASVHYAGTLPMTDGYAHFTTDRQGRCRPFENLLVADGSTLPSLPAKNLTFTLMANATRIATEALGGD